MYIDNTFNPNHNNLQCFPTTFFIVSIITTITLTLKASPSIHPHTPPASFLPFPTLLFLPLVHFMSMYEIHQPLPFRTSLAREAQTYEAYPSEQGFLS